MLLALHNLNEHLQDLSVGQMKGAAPETSDAQQGSMTSEVSDSCAATHLQAACTTWTGDVTHAGCSSRTVQLASQENSSL